MLSLDDSEYLDDSDQDSALMDDALSEPISSSVTTSASSSLSDDEHLSIQQIDELLQRRDKGKLIKLAKSFGLQDIRYRKRIWPMLIRAPTYCSIHFDPTSQSYSLPSDNYYSAGLHLDGCSFVTLSPRFESNREASLLRTSEDGCRTNVETLSTK